MLLFQWLHFLFLWTSFFVFIPKRYDTDDTDKDANSITDLCFFPKNSNLKRKKSFSKGRECCKEIYYSSYSSLVAMSSNSGARVASLLDWHLQDQPKHSPLPNLTEVCETLVGGVFINHSSSQHLDSAAKRQGIQGGHCELWWTWSMIVIRMILTLVSDNPACTLTRQHRERTQWDWGNLRTGSQSPQNPDRQEIFVDGFWLELAIQIFWHSDMCFG